MRTDLMLLAVAVLGVGFDRVVATPSADMAPELQLAQNVGPLATPAVNPGLGSAPPGGHLPGSVEAGREAAQARRAADAAAAQTGGGNLDGSAVPADAAGRVGVMNENRLGAPPVGAVPNAPTGAVPNAPVGAVPPPATGAVGVAPGANAPGVGR